MFGLILYLAADTIVRILPRPLSEALCIRLARLAFWLGVPARRPLERNLARLMAPAPAGAVRARARASFEHFALSFVDFLRLGHLRRAEIEAAIEVHGAEHLETARRSGRGVIVLSAHLGNWEWGAAFVASGAHPLHIVARPHPNGRIERFFHRRRKALGVSLLDGRPLWTSAARVLRRREWVALMADRADASQARAGSVCAWAMALSRRTGALVLPVIMVRLPDRRYATYFEPPVAPEGAPGEPIREILRRYLVRYPEQWFAFETLPEGLA